MLGHSIHTLWNRYCRYQRRHGGVRLPDRKRRRRSRVGVGVRIAIIEVLGQDDRSLSIRRNIRSGNAALTRCRRSRDHHRGHPARRLQHTHKTLVSQTIRGFSQQDLITWSGWLALLLESTGALSAGSWASGCWVRVTAGFGAAPCFSFAMRCFCS